MNKARTFSNINNYEHIRQGRQQMRAEKLSAFTVLQSQVLGRQLRLQMVIDACAELNLVALRKHRFSCKLSSEWNRQLSPIHTSKQLADVLLCWLLTDFNPKLPLTLPRNDSNFYLCLRLSTPFSIFLLAVAQGKNGWHKKIAQKLTSCPGILIFETRLSNSDLSFIKLSILR